MVWSHVNSIISQSVCTTLRSPISGRPTNNAVSRWRKFYHTNSLLSKGYWTIFKQNCVSIRYEEKYILGLRSHVTLKAT